MRVYNGEIRPEGIITGKSTDLKEAYIRDGLQFTLGKHFVRLGNCEFRNVKVLLQYQTEPLIKLAEQNGEFLLSTRFYDCSGELVFWMSSNKYWAKHEFSVTSQKNQLLISNIGSDNSLRIWQQDDFLNIESKNYVKGMALHFTPTRCKLGNSVFESKAVSNCLVGVQIGSPI
jgi:hypothetical protein